MTPRSFIPGLATLRTLSVVPGLAILTRAESGRSDAGCAVSPAVLLRDGA